MESRILQLISALRASGVRVSLAESAEAFSAVDLMGIQDREHFRLSLRSTLIKDVRDLPVFVAWIPLLGALRAMQMWLEEDAGLDRSDYLRASDARQLMDRIRPGLLAAGVDLPDERGVHGADYWPVFVDTVEVALRSLRPRE